MKLRKKQGFTLMEMIVVIAVTGIFFTITSLILSSSINLFGKNQDQSGNFSDTITVERIVSDFFNTVNSEGLMVTYDDEAKTFISKNDLDDKVLYKLEISDNLVKETKKMDEIEDVFDYEYKKIRIKIILLSESDNVCFEYYVEDELIRKNIYYVIGGI